jgi:hypothetical protein
MVGGNPLHEFVFLFSLHPSFLLFRPFFDADSFLVTASSGSASGAILDSSRPLTRLTTSLLANSKDSSPPFVLSLSPSFPFLRLVLPFPASPAHISLYYIQTKNAAFTIAGPEFLTSASFSSVSFPLALTISAKVVSGETKNPRTVLPRAFRATIYRLVIFFIGMLPPFCLPRNR